jgi:hypothetical protein
VSKLKLLTLGLLLRVLTCGLAQEARAEIVVELKNPDELGEQTSKSEVSPKPSDVSFQFRLPLEKLSTIINQFKFTIPAGGDSVTSVQVSVSSSGVDGYPLRLVIPLKLHAAGTALDGAASLNFGIGVAANGCPLKVQSPSVDFPNGGIVGFFVAQKVASEIDALLSCDRIKERLATAWRAVELPIAIGSNAIYVNVGPQMVAISDLSVDNQKKEVIFGGRLSAIVTLTSHVGQGPQVPPLNLSHIDSTVSSGAPGFGELTGNASLFLVPDLGKK